MFRPSDCLSVLESDRERYLVGDDVVGIKVGKAVGSEVKVGSEVAGFGLEEGMGWDEEESGEERGGTFHPPSPPSTSRRTVFSRNPFQFFPSTHPRTHSAPKWMSLTPPEDLSLTVRQMRLVPGFGMR